MRGIGVVMIRRLLICLFVCVGVASAQPLDTPVLESMPAEDVSAVAAFTGAGTGTYFTAVAATKYYGVIIQNTTDSGIVVSFDGGSTDHISMDAGDNLTINFREFGLFASGAISLKDDGSAPTSGNVRILLIK